MSAFEAGILSLGGFYIQIQLNRVLLFELIGLFLLGARAPSPALRRKREVSRQFAWFSGLALCELCVPLCLCGK